MGMYIVTDLTTSPIPFASTVPAQDEVSAVLTVDDVSTHGGSKILLALSTEVAMLAREGGSCVVYVSPAAGA